MLRKSAIISSTMSVQTTVSHELCGGKGLIRCQSISLVLAIVKNCLKRPGEAHTSRTKPEPSHGRPDHQPLTTTHQSRSRFVFSACIKLSGNQRTYLYSGGSGLSIDIHFVDIELSYDVLSPLPIVLSKHFNLPHPYIEIATAISDI